MCEFSCLEELFLEMKMKREFRAKSVLFKKISWQTSKTEWVYNFLMWFEELLLKCCLLLFKICLGLWPIQKKRIAWKSKKATKTVYVRNIKGK